MGRAAALTPYRLQVARDREPQRVPVLVRAVAGVHPSLEGELPHLDLFRGTGWRYRGT